MKALVVEDDLETQSLLADFLLSRGHDVTAVADAEEAWEACVADVFPLILLDWALPGMDGLELCRRLRTEQSAPDSVIVAVTGRTGPDVLSTMLNAGANDFLPKPFTPAMLEVRLEIAERQVAEIHARNQLVQELAHNALYDALTDLPNRRYLEDHLRRAITLSEATSARLAVLVLDLDQFKSVNDTLGHARGDLLLREVAARLRAILRASDTVARLGGDEFVILLPDTDVAGATTVAWKIMDALTAPFVVEEKTVTVGTSIGIALYPEDGRDAEALIRGADTAMYRAKEMGTGFALSMN